MTTTPRRYRAAVPAAIAILLLTAACGGSGDSSDADGGAVPELAQADGAEGADLAQDLQEGTTSLRSGATATDAAPDDLPDERAIIHTGNVALVSDDVAQSAFDVQKVVDAHGGETSEEETATDEDGEVERARMVVRVPAADFDEAFAELEKTAELDSSTATSEDVTAQVIDTDVRIRAQRRSLQRVEVLLDRASSIRDIMRIEAELTRRQSTLDSLEQRQAHLAAQTSMSTITVSIQRTSQSAPATDDDAGFVSGLSAGWTALGTFVTGLATVAGWLLPFSALLALVLVPTWLLVRARRRRTSPGAAG
jgi:hypothetical protein